MIKQDLIDNSPVRFFDSISNGGLKNGQMGLITSKKGLGKTSVLVQFAIDSLLQDKHVVHISFDQHSSNVITWYDSVLSEIGKKKNLSDMSEISNVIMRDRTILNTNQETFSMEKIVNTLSALVSGGISVDCLIIDGIDLQKLSKDDIEKIAGFVKDKNIIAWFSDTNESTELSTTLKADIEPLFATVAHIAASGKAVCLSLLKSDNQAAKGSITLNTKTMLMSEGLSK